MTNKPRYAGTVFVLPAPGVSPGIAPAPPTPPTPATLPAPPTPG